MNESAHVVHIIFLLVLLMTHISWFLIRSVVCWFCFISALKFLFIFFTPYVSFSIELSLCVFLLLFVVYFILFYFHLALFFFFIKWILNDNKQLQPVNKSIFNAPKWQINGYSVNRKNSTTARDQNQNKRNKRNGFVKIPDYFLFDISLKMKSLCFYCINNSFLFHK